MEVLFSKENLIHAISGATGSVVAMSTFYPLDIVRTYQQVGFPASSQPRVNFTSTDKRRASVDREKWFSVMQDIISRQGIGALYNGLGAVNKSLCASNFVYFYAYHALKNMLKNRDIAIGAHLNLLLAMCAGVINVLVTTPLWVANTRIKLQAAKCVPSAANKDYYKGLIDCLYKIWSSEGVGALWAGTSPSLLLVLNPAIHWAVYETLKDICKTETRKHATLYLFVIGAMAKCVAAVLTYPLQLLQSRLRAQMKNSSSNVNKDADKKGNDSDDQLLHLSMIQYFLNILRTQGLKGLFKGLEVKLWQTVLTAAFMFTIYEKLNSTILYLIQSKQT